MADDHFDDILDHDDEYYEVYGSDTCDQPTGYSEYVRYVTSEDRDRERKSREYEYSIEESEDDSIKDFYDDAIPIPSIHGPSVPSNNLDPRQQEEADHPIREGMRYLLDNKFMRAKAIFQSNASNDPLYSLGLGIMAFVRAIMTHHPQHIDIAVRSLKTTIVLAQAQMDNSQRKKGTNSFSQYFGDYPLGGKDIQEKAEFLANSTLRAHVIKAESSLLISLLHLSQDSLVNYIKCGLHLRRAYKSYNLVWQEYKRMGQEYTKFMDRDTVSGIQFGIGVVQLLLSSFPRSMHQINQVLGWKHDKELGIALLKLCAEGYGMRSCLASLIMVAYYTVLTSFAPQLYTRDLIESAMECLNEAQKQHPRSCFFLFFAAQLSRNTRNIPLSNQAFQLAAEASKGEWAEQSMKHLTDHEVALNDCIQLNWEAASAEFTKLEQKGYWSPAFSKYMVGACHEMLGQRTEAILAFAEVSQLIQRNVMVKQQLFYVDAYLQRKITQYQQDGYQHMDLYLPALEILLIWNAMSFMETDSLLACLNIVQHALDMIYEREKVEHGLRMKELIPKASPPNYSAHRAVLLLLKASILNSLGKPEESVTHLNWVLDHKHLLKQDQWVVPFTYWEAGITCWQIGDRSKSKQLWEQAATYRQYDFEHRLSIRLHMALHKCDDLKILCPPPAQTLSHNLSNNGRKRLPLVIFQGDK
ncbi:hypothetical protein DM01DRAFT_1324416 [Hesseltinella vesiculosa]|uniref:TPR-like protein n=1 Tax=Hesseltinella vesiculosa TaxID=101127 RepID=A0A1X2GDI8_9FUNG|nr:hypothetical protein DM01DRAFT_1324416 [Hesseltinella vesiculosa]